MSQIELSRAIIRRSFEAYNNKNETIFDEIISSDYVDNGQYRIQNGRMVETWHMVDGSPSKIQRWSGEV